MSLWKYSQCLCVVYFPSLSFVRNVFFFFRILVEESRVQDADWKRRYTEKCGPCAAASLLWITIQRPAGWNQETNEKFRLGNSRFFYAARCPGLSQSIKNICKFMNHFCCFFCCCCFVSFLCLLRKEKRRQSTIDSFGFIKHS